MANLKLSQIKQMMRSAAHKDQYDTWYTMALFLSGDPTAIQHALAGGTSVDHIGLDTFSNLHYYPEILPTMDRFGLQNHGFVNSRINVHGAVVEPEIEFGHPNPVVREYNQAYISWYWNAFDWTTEFHNVGMWTDSCGIGWARQIEVDGRPTWECAPLLDMLWDPVNKTPGQWEWVADRRRISEATAIKTYGDIKGIKEKLKNCIGEYDTYKGANGGSSTTEYLPRLLIQWVFRSETDLMIMLMKPGAEDRSPVCLRYNAEGKLELASGDDPVAGPNPWGVLRAASWTDSWLPMNRRPVGKGSDGVRISGLLNWVEKYIIQFMRNNMPIVALNADAVDPKLVEEIRKANDLKALEKILLLQGDPNEIIKRIPGGELPASLLHMRQILRDEMNATTGTQDMNRGQALSGERTRYEVSQLVDMSGIVARAFKQNYVTFVKAVVRQQRHVGSIIDKGVMDLHLPSYGTISTADYDPQQFLAADMEPHVDYNGKSWMSEEEIMQRTLMELKEFLLPGVQMGAFDPVKVFNSTAMKLGYLNPSRELGIEMPAVDPMAMQQNQPAPQ